MNGNSRRHTVRALQEWLRARGQTQVKVDGAYGSQTAAAAAAVDDQISSLLEEAVRASQPRVAVTTSTKRDPRIEALVRDECRKQGVAFEPVAAIIDHESRWNHSARSSTGAVGLFQLTSWPGRQYNLDVRPALPYSNDDRYDLEVNIFLGVWYIAYCARQMGVSPLSTSPDDWARIYGAYNLGPGTMTLLLRGQYDHDAVKQAWAVQSTALKQGGIANYEQNARSLFV